MFSLLICTDFSLPVKIESQAATQVPEIGLKKITDDVALCVVFFIDCFFYAKIQNREATNQRHDTDLCASQCFVINME